MRHTIARIGLPPSPSRSTPSAADLKFPAVLAANSFRNLKSISGTRNISLLVPLCFQSFVSEGAAMYHEFQNRHESEVIATREHHALPRHR